MAEPADATHVDPIVPLLVAVGSLVAFAGMLFADGTELAVGGLIVVAALRRAVSAQTNGCPSSGAGGKREHRMDALYIGLTVILFASTLGLVRLCERV